MTVSKLDAALELARRGFKVFPIKAGAKTPPLIKDWPTHATTNEVIVNGWWTQIPDANIGIHCDGMIVVDVDVKNNGNETLKYLELNYGLPNTLTTLTPSGGKHLFYRSRQNVPNGVATLGSGIDIRSGNGYVVAPGSVVPAGRYRFEADVGIAGTPEWLVQKLNVSTSGERKEKIVVADAPGAVMAQAQKWLDLQPPAIEGQGGDAHTFAVACGLRDFGISVSQAYELLFDWNLTCSPPWSDPELRDKIRNAYAYGHNDPGVKGVDAGEFSTVQSIEQNSVKVVSRSAPKRLSEIVNTNSAGPGYLIKGLLNRGSQVVTYGAPGEGKTFVALDIAYHVAAGMEWMGRRVHQGTVLYLAYEGMGGLVRRAMALHKQYGTKDVPLYIHSADYNLRDVTGRQALGCVLAALPEKPTLIVIDTLARAMKGGDENSAQDMGALMDAVGALAENTGACVMLIHHSGKNKAGGARGSSALPGAIDTELEIDQQQINTEKQRDIEMLQEPIGFMLKPLIVGIDEEGDSVTSCVVMPAKIVQHTTNISGNPKRAFDVLCERRPTNEPITDEEWREACAEFLPNRRGAMWDVKRALLRADKISIDLKTGMTTRRIE